MQLTIYEVELGPVLPDGAMYFDSIAEMEMFLVDELLKHLCSPTVDCDITVDFGDEDTYIPNSQFKRIVKQSGSSDDIFVFPDRLRYFAEDVLSFYVIWAKVRDGAYIQLNLSRFEESHPEDRYIQECYLRDVYTSNFDRIAACIKENPSTYDVSMDSDNKTITYKLSGRLSEY